MIEARDLKPSAIVESVALVTPEQPEGGIAPRASILFDWKPEVMAVDDGNDLLPFYYVAEEATPSVAFVRPRAEDLPSFGIWADRTESDEELLEKLGGNWRDFGVWD